MHSGTLFYLLGLVSGDGHIELTRNRIDIRVKDEGFRCYLANLLVVPNVYTDDKHLRIRIVSKELVKQMVDTYGIPKGKKSYSLKVSPSIKNAAQENQLLYLAGWYDSEGWLEIDMRRKPPYPRIRFAVVNSDVIHHLSTILSSIGVGPSVFTSGKRICIDVNGRRNVNNFFLKVPVKHSKWKLENYPLFSTE